MDTRISEFHFETHPAGWRDLGGLRQIEKECFPLDAWPLLDMVAVLTFSGVVRLKAVIDDRIVGFIAGEKKDHATIGWIATIGVLPSYQRRGIARSLLRDCEASLDVSRIRLSVRTENVAAIHLYEKAGYERIGQWKRYYQDGSDAIIYEKIYRGVL